MKRVLFVINTMGHAGAEVAMLELMERLLAKKEEPVSLSLYVLTGQGELISKLPAEVTLCNTKYHDASVLSEEGRGYLRKTVLRASVCRVSVLRNLPYLVRNGLAMVRKKRVQPDKLIWRVLSDGGQRLDEEYDLAVSYLEGGSAYYVADHVKAKKKAAFIHIDYGQAGYTRALDKDCYLKFDRIFTVSQEVKQHFLEAYPQCSAYTDVFHNILNEERICRMAKEPGGFADDFDGIRILTVGRLVYQKAYDVAVRAMELLVREAKQRGDLKVRWYVVGEGELREELEAQIQQAGLQEYFVLLGAKKNPYPFFAQADIYAHFTRFEGKSIALQEAQILGKPIAASDCSGNREQIESGVDGLLCDLTPEKMKKALLYLIDYPKEASQFAKRAVRKQMEYEEDIQMLFALLR